MNSPMDIPPPVLSRPPGPDTDPPGTTRLLVVIVNYRTSGLTIDCLRSLEAEVIALPGELRVVVTDNASGDGSAVPRAAVAPERLGRLGSDPTPGAERRVRVRQQHGDPPRTGSTRSSSICPAAEPGHDGPARGPAPS